MATSFNEHKRKKNAQRTSRGAKKAIALLRDIDLGKVKTKPLVKA